MRASGPRCDRSPFRLTLAPPWRASLTSKSNLQFSRSNFQFSITRTIKIEPLLNGQFSQSCSIFNFHNLIIFNQSSSSIDNHWPKRAQRAECLLVVPCALDVPSTTCPRRALELVGDRAKGQRADILRCRPLEDDELITALFLTT